MFTLRKTLSGVKARRAVLLLLPHLTLALVSLVPYGAWTTEILPPVLSFENYRRLFSEAERLRPLINSLWMSVVSTAAALMLALAGNPLVKLYLFVLIALPLYHWAHRFRFVLEDVGLHGLRTPIAILCYGAAVLGTVATLWVLWQI